MSQLAAFGGGYFRKSLLLVRQKRYTQSWCDGAF